MKPARALRYREAIDEATRQAMAKDERIVVLGVQVIMPATPGDAKGLLMTAYSTDSPVLCLEHRWLYETSGPVPEEPYYVPIGTATVAREGSDVTIVAVSHMVVEALQAAEI